MTIIREILSNGYKAEFTVLVSILALLAGISIIISKNPIISVMCLIGLFVNMSLYLMILGGLFIGLSYLLVYVGAVSILFIFILMLINVRISELLTEGRNSLPLAIMTILIFSFSLSPIIPYSLSEQNISASSANLLWNSFANTTLSFFDLAINNVVNNRIGSVYAPSWDSVLAESSHISSIGNILYTNLFILLIVTSLILLVAMVGAIVITIKPQSNIKNTIIKDFLSV